MTKAMPGPPIDVKPKRGRPSKNIGDHISSRISKLQAREAKVIKKQTKPIKFQGTEGDWEKLLTLAERWDEQLEVVMRACLREGADHYLNWAGNSGPYSPFTKGDLTPRRPSQLDPSGLVFPPPQIHQWGGVPTVRGYQPPAPRQTVREFTEPVFSQTEVVKVGRKGRGVPLAALLPNGATEMSEPEPEMFNEPEELVQETGIFDMEEPVIEAVGTQ